MKYTWLLLTLVIFMIACQPTQQEDPNAVPEDLAGKKAWLKEKKGELRQLNQQITQVEAEIEALLPPSQKAKKAVTTIPIYTNNFKRYVAIQATVQSDDLVSVSSEVGGRIVRLTVKEGSLVRRGQLIAKIDLEQIDKQIAELRTALQLATEVFQRQERLWKQNIGSELQFLEAKNNKERLEKSLETVRFQKGKANVYAPIAGIVENEYLKQGEMASPGMPIVQILNTKKVKVVADVPENYLGKIAKGELVDIHFPALDKKIQAKVSQLGRTIDAANRTFKAEVEIPNPEGLLKPNLLASMELNDFSVDNVVTIPLELVQQEVSGKDYVFVVHQSEDGTVAKKMYIETGESHNGLIIIKSGLVEGQSLINEGARGLTDGEFITVKADKTESAISQNLIEK